MNAVGARLTGSVTACVQPRARTGSVSIDLAFTVVSVAVIVLRSVVPALSKQPGTPLSCRPARDPFRVAGRAPRQSAASGDGYWP
jgi:hypothetical protein